MDNDNKYLYATAEIEGEKIEFYRYGKREEIFFYRQYNAQDINWLTRSINNNIHIIKHKFSTIGYFYSDKFSFCKNNVPEVICEILKREFNTNVNACGQGEDYIVYTEKLTYILARNKYNEHYNGNLL